MESIQNFFKDLYERIERYVRANPRRTAIYVGALVLLILGFVIPVAEPHVALSGEPILSDGPDWLTNSIVTTIVVDIIILIMAVAATVRMKLVPGGWQNAMEALLEYAYNLSEAVAGRAARRYFPWVMTIFLFVLISNWSGLIPGVGSIGFYHEEAEGGSHAVTNYGVTNASSAREVAARRHQELALADGNLILVSATDEVSLQAQEVPEGEEEEVVVEGGHPAFVPLFRAPSADLNMTFALAIATMVMVQIHGIRALGGRYFHKFFNADGEGFIKYVNSFVGILELISEFSRTIAFGFRLFGNIFAGEIILATMAFLIAFLLPLPFYALEIFVGVIQALVFMMLALVFFSMATISHDADHGH